MLIRNASSDYLFIYSLPVVPFPLACTEEGHLNANVSMNQTKGAVGSANQRNLLCYRGGVGAGGGK